MYAENKEHEVRASTHFIALGEFFPKGFLNKVVVNMTSCSELDDDDEKTNEEQSILLKRDNK